MEHHIALKYCYIILGPYEGYDNITETVKNQSYVNVKTFSNTAQNQVRVQTLTGCRVSMKCSIWRDRHT